MAQAQLASKNGDARTGARGWSNPCVAPKLARGKAKIRLHHVMSPTCWWSWGYYGTLGRIRLTYGDQVDLNLVTYAVYEDLDDWLKHNGLTLEGQEKWAKESAKKMGVPIFTEYTSGVLPKDSTPAMLAVLAAKRQGTPAGERFERGLLRRSVVEGIDVTNMPVLVAAAQEAKLDIARFKKDLEDKDGLIKDFEAQTATLPNLPLGFYNLAIEDERGRKIVLDYSFEPDEVVEAIEYLSGGKLKKNHPDDPVEFLKAPGPAHARELARAFGWTPAATESKLQALARKGELKTVQMAGATHWTAA